MALQFNPPEWLIKDYMAQKSPAEEASSGIQTGLATYAQMKLKQSEKQNEALGTYINAVRAGGPKFGAKVAAMLGLKNTPIPGGPSVPPAVSTGTVPSQAPGMTPVENANQMSMPAEHPMAGAPGQASPIIAHWNQTMGQGQAGANYETALNPQEEQQFQAWKSQNAPRDSGYDYDLRGAFKAGFKPGPNGHWDDRFKNPNHPTFSTFSQYAKDVPERAGTWEGDKYIPPAGGRPAASGPELPGEDNPLDLLDQGDFGANRLKGLESVQKLKDSQDAHQEKFGVKTPITKEDLLKKGSYDPAKDFVVEPPANNQDAKDLKRQDQLAKAVTEYGKQIETNPIIKNLQNQSIGLHNVEEMSQLTQQGNTVASAAMGMKMARAMGEVGVITEQDVKRYVQSRKLTQAAADKLSGWVNGVPSKATLEEIGQITEALRDSYDSKIQPIYNRYIERFARAYKISNEDAAYQLAFPYEKGTGASTSQGGSMPQVGSVFQGFKVLKVTETTKANKPK